MKLTTQWSSRLILTTAACVAFTASTVMAQDRTTTTTTTGAANTSTQVERGTVTYVSGNDLIVKMDSGVVRYFNVPDSARATVDGKELSVHDLKPGMKLQRTITTIETPKTVSTVRTIQGKVVQIIPPLSLILSFPQGPNKQYHIPEDQKFVVDGKTLTAFELKPGMSINATAVSTVESTTVTQQRATTGTAPAPAPAPAPVAAEPKPATPVLVGVLLIEVSAPAPAPVPTATARPAAAPAPPAEPAPAKLPKTGTDMPLIGLLGLLSCAASLGLRLMRRD